MRPSSAGSRRMSKRLLPDCADCAISTATPLSGTGVLAASVAVNCGAVATMGAVVGSGGCVVMLVGWGALVDAGCTVSGVARSCAACAACFAAALPESGLTPSAETSPVPFLTSFVVDAVACVGCGAIPVAVPVVSDLASLSVVGLASLLAVLAAAGVAAAIRAAKSGSVVGGVAVSAAASVPVVAVASAAAAWAFSTAAAIASGAVAPVEASTGAEAVSTEAVTTGMTTATAATGTALSDSAGTAAASVGAASFVSLPSWASFVSLAASFSSLPLSGLLSLRTGLLALLLSVASARSLATLVWAS